MVARVADVPVIWLEPCVAERSVALLLVHASWTAGSPHAGGANGCGASDGWLAAAGATMARDVPFSAIYWGSLEPIRRMLLPRDAPASHSQVWFCPGPGLKRCISII